MAEAHAHAHKNHDYHLVDPSPWPVIGAVSAFALALGLIAYMHSYSPFWMVPGASSASSTRCSSGGATPSRNPTPTTSAVVQLGLRYGMILFIASEVMFFLAWFWAFFNASLDPDSAKEFVKAEFTGGHWPPQGIEVFDPWHFPLLNTLILLTSGTTVTWAHHALLHNDRKGLIWGLVCTILLGLTFTGVQAYEYAHAAFSFGGNIYGSTFFMATGFHGFHVHRRHDLPDRLPDPRLSRPVHAEAAFRLRGGRLVLALRRRGLALPVLFHLHLGGWGAPLAE